jgi:hypothetical protein
VHIAGTYAIRPNNTCIFLASDFDKDSWKQDVNAYKKAAKEFGIECYVEISKSGNGGDGEIRTLGTGKPVRRLSKALPSATRAHLRKEAKWRRTQDSNLRTREGQWFSKPPLSTAQPILRDV